LQRNVQLLRLDLPSFLDLLLVGDDQKFFGHIKHLYVLDVLWLLLPLFLTVEVDHCVPHCGPDSGVLLREVVVEFKVERCHR
jgi:hypothetical protein